MRTLEGVYNGESFVSPCLSDGTGLVLPEPEETDDRTRAII